MNSVKSDYCFILHISGIAACTTWPGPLPLFRTASDWGLVQGYCDGRELMKQKKRYFCRENFCRLLRWRIIYWLLVCSDFSVWLSEVSLSEQYGEKPSREKTFTNFEILWEVFFLWNLGTWCHQLHQWAICASFLCKNKFFCRVLFHQFSPVTVALYPGST